MILIQEIFLLFNLSIKKGQYLLKSKHRQRYTPPPHFPCMIYTERNGEGGQCLIFTGFYQKQRMKTSIDLRREREREKERDRERERERGREKEGERKRERERGRDIS